MSEPTVATPAKRTWLSRTVLGIVLATFLSDLSHELATAVLPFYLAAIHLGPAALGIIEGVADFLVSIAKLVGGIVGQRTRHKRQLASLAYLVTALAIAAIALVETLLAIVTLRAVAWIARGFRGPLRDGMLADAVDKQYYGRAYGLERAGDMLGAMAGPLIAILLIWAGLEFRTIILWTIVPGALAAAAMYFLTRERALPMREAVSGEKVKFPRAFWWFLVGVFLFGLGDFSRTFLIFLVAKTTGELSNVPAGTFSLAIGLYMMHNLVSALAAYPVGHLGDRRSKLPILVVGYGLGVATNLLLAFVSGNLNGLIVAIVLSGIYIAVEETLEKATAAEMLPRAVRSLGFGIMACTNAVGDMISSLYVGLLLEAGRPELAFGIAAGVGALGVVWMVVFRSRLRLGGTSP